MGKITRLTGGEDDLSPQRLHLRQVPGEAKPESESVGQELRAARLTRKDELAQVSYALRIRKDYLEALETDCPDKLPGRTYAIGFVRSYANYLGLDAPALVARYKLATAGLAESAPRVGPAPEARGFGLGRVWVLAAFAAAAVVAYGIYRLAELPIPTTSGTPVAPAPVHSRSRPSTASTPLVHAAAQVKRPALGAHLPPVADMATLPTGQVFGAQNHNTRVVLHAHALARVLVDGPRGKVYINRLLHPGDVYRVPNLVGLSLTTPDGGAVSLELDGQDIGAAGRTGRLIEALSLDPAAIVERKRAGVPGGSHKVTP